MKTALLAIGLLLPCLTYSQTNFENGYFVRNDGTRNEVLIKNVDWNNNPTSFEYKTAADAGVQVVAISEAREFGIEGVSKFIRTTVDMDMASQRHGNLPRTRVPVFTTRTVFLRVLSEGRETLYSFDESGTNLFFYKTKSDSIKQLVYRKYLGSGSSLLENTAFRTQLAEVRCKGDEPSIAQKLKYKQSDLIAYFDRANACDGEVIQTTSQPVATTTAANASTAKPAVVSGSEKKAVTKLTRKKGYFNLSPAFGYSLFKGEIDSPVNSRDLSFSKSGFSIGAEVEYVLPTNNRKLSVIFEPTYYIFGEVEQTNPINSTTSEHMKFKYNLVQLPIGVRWRFFVSPDSQIFVNAVFNYGIILNDEVEMAVSNNLGMYTTTYSFGAGVGFSLKRFALEARISSSNALVTNLGTGSSVSVGPRFILRYNILKH